MSRFHAEHEKLSFHAGHGKEMSRSHAGRERFSCWYDIISGCLKNRSPREKRARNVNFKARYVNFTSMLLEMFLKGTRTKKHL